MADEPDLTIDIQTDGGVRVLRVAGDLVFESAPALRAAFADHVDEAAVVIDLSGVGFMDSSGLAALLYARKRGIEDGWTLTLRGLGANVATMLRITAVDTLLTIER